MRSTYKNTYTIPNSQENLRNEDHILHDLLYFKIWLTPFWRSSRIVSASPINFLIILNDALYFLSTSNRLLSFFITTISRAFSFSMRFWDILISFNLLNQLWDYFFFLSKNWLHLKFLVNSQWCIFSKSNSALSVYYQLS